MLADDLKEFKRENPEGLQIKTGFCRCCGQSAQIQTLLEWDSDTRNEAATELCECEGARSYTWNKQRKERALNAIDKQFGDKAGENQITEEIIEILKQTVELILLNKITSTTIDIGKGLKAKISLTAKGAIKVERTRTTKATEEA